MKTTLLLVPAALLLLLPQVAQSQSAQPPFPPPGKLFDVGGWRLHLNCTGEARATQPTVILEDEHRRDHAAIAAMSRNGKLIVADKSGHHIQLDQPDLVIKAIQDALAAAKK